MAAVTDEHEPLAAGPPQVEGVRSALAQVATGRHAALPEERLHDGVASSQRHDL